MLGGGRPLGVLNACRVSSINGARVACTAQKEINERVLTIVNYGQLIQDVSVKVIHLGLQGSLGVCLCCSVAPKVLILGLQGQRCVKRFKCRIYVRVETIDWIDNIRRGGCVVWLGGSVVTFFQYL